MAWEFVWTTIVQTFNKLWSRASPVTYRTAGGRDAQLVNAQGKELAPVSFQDNKPHACSQTWQVVGSQFDQMMLDKAREHSALVQQPARVLDVLLDGDQAVGVRVQGGGDLFEDKADEVWGPLELLDPPEKTKIPMWDQGMSEVTAGKANELFLPADPLH